MLPYIYIVLPSYSVMAFLGSFAVLTFLFFRLDDYELTFKEFLMMFAIGGIGCLLGSKLLFFLTVLPTLAQPTFFELVNHFLLSGYVFYGELFGTLTAIGIFSKRAHKNIGAIHRLIAPALPLFHGFGRIGCFLAGCCYGVALDAPIVLVDGIELERLPTQLIEAAFEFMMFGVSTSQWISLLILGYYLSKMLLKSRPR